MKLMKFKINAKLIIVRFITIPPTISKNIERLKQKRAEIERVKLYQEQREIPSASERNKKPVEDFIPLPEAPIKERTG